MNNENKNALGISYEALLEILNRDISLVAFDTIDSTNTEARRYVSGGGAVPALIVANEQSAGRGRLGRSFFSPPDTGVYMTLLLNAKEAPIDNIRLTTAAAAAVSLVIEELCGISVQIKWVNDIYLNDRKICGILAETFSESGYRYAAVGIGLNMYTSDFPDEIKTKAAALMPNTGSRELFAAKIANKLYEFYSGFESALIMDHYRSRSMILGKRISFIENGEVIYAMACGIDDLGVLTVTDDNGVKRNLSAGEVSVVLS